MLASVLIIFLASRVNANGNVVTFQELVCQHCNALHEQDEAPTQRNVVGKAGPRGPPGAPGPRGPPGQVNDTALRELVRFEAKIGRESSSLDINETVLKEIIKKEIELALESFRNQSKVETERVPATEIPDLSTTTASDEWTVFQRRMDGSVDFYRGWNDYVNGFGNEDGEFWLGLDNIYQLTKSRDKELQINMITFDGRYFTARYNLFHIGSAADNYMIHLSGYSGNASDSFRIRQNNMQFSARDADHDTWSSSCAQKRKGGWWFSACYTNLNGIFSRRMSEGTRWFNDNNGIYVLMRYTEMKIRRSV